MIASQINLQQVKELIQYQRREVTKIRVNRYKRSTTTFLKLEITHKYVFAAAVSATPNKEVPQTFTLKPSPLAP